MSTIKQKIAKGSIALVLLFTILLIATYLALKTSLPDYDQKLTLSGLDSDIEIIRDKNAIPHVYASTLADAYFGLGFSHAQDRLWQLELTRAASQGRLSEIFGEATLPVDKMTRTIDSRNIAELSLRRMDTETKRHFQRYIDGVNNYIKHRSGLLPPEFLLFSVEPTPWALEDIAAIFALVGIGADNWQEELKRAAMQQRLTDEQIATLYPRYPADGPITHPIDRTNAANDELKVSKDLTSTDLRSLAYLPSLTQLASHPLFAAYPASNTWVVDGTLTKSGKPLLASDPHGPIKAPADYYLAHLSGPDFDITGVGYVGMPVFAIGHNRHIAWGLTDIIADMSDLYAEKVVHGKPGHYLTPTGEKTFTTRTEVIKVKGQDDVVIEIRSTYHGPVISDVVEAAKSDSKRRGDNIVLALATATFTEGNISAQAFMRINQAKNWSQFKAAMADYEMAQNLSYADTDGNIGMISSARVPLRKSGDGFMITPAWKADVGINGYLDATQMPFSLNPAQGYLVNANNKMISSSYPYFFSREDVMPFRANRIIEKIHSSKEHTVKTMMKIQGDTVSVAARELLPLLLTIQPTPDTASALSLLSLWDGSMNKNRIEPLLYMAWERELNRLLYKDEMGEDFDGYFESRPYLVKQLLTQKQNWCDDIQTKIQEACPEIISRALQKALHYLSEQYGEDTGDWTWGKAHNAVFSNDIFTHVPLIKNFSDIMLPNDGGPHTVNQARSKYNSPNPFNQNYGPRFRQIIDLSNLDNSRFMIAPGVSGNFFSPYYGHLAELWHDQKYITLETRKSSLSKKAIGTTRLSKAGG